jgi:hypothetical protein
VDPVVQTPARWQRSARNDHRIAFHTGAHIKSQPDFRGLESQCDPEQRRSIAVLPSVLEFERGMCSQSRGIEGETKRRSHPWKHHRRIEIRSIQCPGDHESQGIGLVCDRCFESQIGRACSHPCRPDLRIETAYPGNRKRDGNGGGKRGVAVQRTDRDFALRSRSVGELPAQAFLTAPVVSTTAVESYTTYRSPGCPVQVVKSSARQLVSNSTKPLKFVTALGMRRVLAMLEKAPSEAPPMESPPGCANTTIQLESPEPILRANRPVPGASNAWFAATTTWAGSLPQWTA